MTQTVTTNVSRRRRLRALRLVKGVRHFIRCAAQARDAGRIDEYYASSAAMFARNAVHELHRTHPRPDFARPEV